MVRLCILGSVANVEQIRALVLYRHRRIWIFWHDFSLHTLRKVISIGVDLFHRK